jgi:hypothetical protein
VISGSSGVLLAESGTISVDDDEAIEMACEVERLALTNLQNFGAQCMWDIHRA